MAERNAAIALAAPRYSMWRSRLRGEAPFDVRSAGTYRLLAIQALVIVFLIRALEFSYTGEDINPMIGVLTSTVAVAALLRWRGISRIASAIEAIALGVASSMAAACLSVLVATLGLPYCDPLLASLDRIIFPFLSWPDLARAAGGKAQLMAIMCWIYSSLLWQPFALAALLAAFGRLDRLWQFVHAWALALVACVVVFAVMPALAAYVHYGVAAAETPFLTVHTGWRPTAITEGVRSGEIRELGVRQMSGLITFPSFHAAGAVLLAWGFRRVPLLGIAFIALNIAMLSTIPVIGSHYFVDVLGGVAVAMLAIAGTRTGVRPDLPANH